MYDAYLVGVFSLLASATADSTLAARLALLAAAKWGDDSAAFDGLVEVPASALWAMISELIMEAAADRFGVGWQLGGWEGEVLVEAMEASVCTSEFMTWLALEELFSWA